MIAAQYDQNTLAEIARRLSELQRRILQALKDKGAALVLLLSQAEPLIAAVEEWLESPWDPRPAAGHFTSVTASEAVVRDPALAPPGTRLVLPLDFLLSPPPHTLQPPRLSWPCHVAEVVLALVDPEALDQLEPGGLLWLPASFGGRWPISLRDPHGKLPPCHALFDMAGQQLVLGRREGVERALRRTGEHAVPAGAALGGTEGPPSRGTVPAFG